MVNLCIPCVIVVMIPCGGFTDTTFYNRYCRTICFPVLYYRPNVRLPAACSDSHSDIVIDKVTLSSTSVFVYNPGPTSFDIDYCHHNFYTYILYFISLLR